MGQTCCGLEAATEAKEAYQDLEAMYRKIERLEVRLSSRDERLIVANARVCELESQVQLLQQGRQYVTMEEFSPEVYPFGDEYDRDEITSELGVSLTDIMQLVMAESAGRHIIVIKRITAANEMVSSWKNLMRTMTTALEELKYQEKIGRVQVINEEWKSLTTLLAHYHSHAAHTTSPRVSPVADQASPRLDLDTAPSSARTETSEDVAVMTKAKASLQAARAALAVDLKDVVTELHTAADELEAPEEIMLDEVQRAAKSLAVAEADSAQRFNTPLDRTASMIEGSPASHRNSAISQSRAADSPSSLTR